MKDFILRNLYFHSKRIQESWEHKGNKHKQLKSLFAGYYWFFRSKITTKPKIVSVFKGLKFKCFTDSSHALSYFFNGTEFDNWHIMKFIDNILQPNDKVIDIGANVGLFTLLSASNVGENGYIIAIEPMPKNVIKLQDNIKINNLHNIKVMQIGLSDQIGDFYFTYEDVGSHMTELKSTNSEKIKCLKLDTILENETLEFVVTKIDVEGMELLVLKGAEESMKKNILPIIIFEVNGLNLRFGLPDKDITDFMKKNDYIFGNYNHDTKTLCFDNQLHDDTIAIKNGYQQNISFRYKDLIIEYK